MLIELSMTHERAIRVFVVDDHPVVRSGLQTMLESTGDFILSGMAASSEEAISTFSQTETDVALLDLRMPGMDGLELLARFRSNGVSVPVVVLTNYHSDEDI